MSSTELMPVENQLVEFGSFRSPDQVMKEAQAVAVVFQREARRLQLYKKIGDSEHLLIEGWQMLAAQMRVTASVVSTREIQIGDAHGWGATAEAIYVPTGQKISSADAICMNDEDKWGMVSKYEWQQGKKVKVGEVAKPQHQLLSMAQTRATSKVLSNLLKWVAKMSGFATTPAEEVDHAEEAPPQPRAKPAQSTDINTITEAQTRRLYALAKEHGKSQEEMKGILQRFSFAHSKDITFDKYDAICAEVVKGENQ